MYSATKIMVINFVTLVIALKVNGSNCPMDLALPLLFYKII